MLATRALRSGHSLSQHTHFQKNNMTSKNDFFYETMIQSIRPTRSHLARFACILLALLARVLRFVLTKIFEKKSVSQLSRNALKRIEMQKKKKKNFTPLTDYALRA